MHAFRNNFIWRQLRCFLSLRGAMIKTVRQHHQKFVELFWRFLGATLICIVVLDAKFAINRWKQNFLKSQAKQTFRVSSLNCFDSKSVPRNLLIRTLGWKQEWNDDCYCELSQSNGSLMLTVKVNGENWTFWRFRFGIWIPEVPSRRRVFCLMNPSNNSLRTP